MSCLYETSTAIFPKHPRYRDTDRHDCEILHRYREIGGHRPCRLKKRGERESIALVKPPGRRATRAPCRQPRAIPSHEVFQQDWRDTYYMYHIQVQGMTVASIDDTDGRSNEERVNEAISKLKAALSREG